MLGAPELIQERTPLRNSWVRVGTSAAGMAVPHQVSQVPDTQLPSLVHSTVESSLQRWETSNPDNVQLAGVVVTQGVASSFSISQLASALPGSTILRPECSALGIPTMSAWVISTQPPRAASFPKQQDGQAGTVLTA